VVAGQRTQLTGQSLDTSVLKSTMAQTS